MRAGRDSINIIIAGVGGQGNVTAGIIMGEAARLAGLNAVMSEIHGLAQRGGIVSVDFRIGNVYGPIIPDGEVDLILGFEILESLRALSRARPGTVVITSTERIVPSSVNVGEAKYPDLGDLRSRAVARGARIYEIDAPSIALAAGSALASNMVMVGAAMGAGFLPVGMNHVRDAIRIHFRERLWEVNERAVEMGFQEIRRLMGAAVP
ncbi:MAG: indolepyruvate oxidoreductase subunit beta [Conexivisphaera sp.]